jgi:phospholipase/carboxylesterase
MLRRVIPLGLGLLVACDAGPSATPATTTSASSSSSSSADATAPSAPQADAQGFHRAGGLRYLVRHTGGASARDEVPMVVAIHGLGDRPDRFALFAQYPRPARVLVPQAPAPHGGGFSWFPIRVRGSDPAKVAAGMRVAAGKLAAMIEAATARHPTRGKPVVTGFSQGGMLSFALAVEHPQLIAGAVPIAGWLPEPMWPRAAPVSAPPIVALHGDADPVLPIQPTRDGVGHLRSIGWTAELLEYPSVPHRVRPDMLREVYRRVDALTQAK